MVTRLKRRDKVKVVGKLFNKLVDISKLEESFKSIFETITGEGVLQMIHGGKQIKVVITQEHYLSMLAKIEHYEYELGVRDIPKSGLPKPTLEEDLTRLRKRRDRLEGRS